MLKGVFGRAGLLSMCLLAPGCGTRSQPNSDACPTPNAFPQADGEPSGCEVIDLLACTTTLGAVVLCEGGTADCPGTPVDAGSCRNACSEVAYALKCPEHGVFLGNPPGAPQGCVALSTPQSAPALACCPCLSE